MNRTKSPRLVVLAGGTSSEQEVSRGSGRACAIALARSFPTRLIEVTTDELPAGIDRDRDIVFSTLHGVFGEDGGMQRLLEEAGIIFAGCDAVSSELTFDKVRTKEIVAAAGVPVAPGWEFSGGTKPTVEEIGQRMGDAVVFKPNRAGSSVGLSICANRIEVAESLNAITDGDWLVEQRVVGRELTVGLLGGVVLPVVEIRPKSGIFDYRSKYTPGMTEYLAPAPLPPAVAARVQDLAANAFRSCGCRDYARIDFMMTERNEFIFLEINTLPGMKETSLLPMGAKCAGLDFTALVQELVRPALARFRTLVLSAATA